MQPLVHSELAGATNTINSGTIHMKSIIIISLARGNEQECGNNITMYLAPGARTSSAGLTERVP
jgi:hypothetical protein